MKRVGLFEDMQTPPEDHSDLPHRKGRARFFFGSQIQTQIRVGNFQCVPSQLRLSERVVKHNYGLAKTIQLPNRASTDPDATHPESASPFCSTVEAYPKTHPAATQGRPHWVTWCHTNTIIPELGNPQAWDRYAYSMNSPIKYIDPSGHWPWSNDWTINLDTSVIAQSAVNWVNNTFDLDITSEFLANTAVTADKVAMTIDAISTGLVVVGGIAGGVGGGPKGAVIGALATEAAVKPALLIGNILASTSTTATISSEALSGDLGAKLALSSDSEGLEPVMNFSLELVDSRHGTKSLSE